MASTLTTASATASHPGRDGALAVLPFVVAYVPFALVVGSAVAATDQPLAGWTGSWLIYGGSAQLGALRAMQHGGALPAIATGLVIHTRLVVYSASLAARWRTQPRWFRVIAPALLIDPTWAAAESHHGGEVTDAEHRRFVLSAGLTLGAGWSTAMAVGIVAGARLPSAGLEAAVPLCLASLLGPRLRERSQRWAAAGGAAVAVVAAGAPVGTAVGLAIVAGCLAGTLAERVGP